MLIEHVLETLGNYLSSPFFINESINKSSISGKAYQPLKMRDNFQVFLECAQQVFLST